MLANLMSSRKVSYALLVPVREMAEVLRGGTSCGIAPIPRGGILEPENRLRTTTSCEAGRPVEHQKEGPQVNFERILQFNVLFDGGGRHVRVGNCRTGITRMQVGHELWNMIHQQSGITPQVRCARVGVHFEQTRYPCEHPASVGATPSQSLKLILQAAELLRSSHWWTVIHHY